MHSEEGLNRLPLGAICFLWHYDDTVCSAGRLVFQSPEGVKAGYFHGTCYKDKIFYSGRFTYRSREVARNFS